MKNFSFNQQGYFSTIQAIAVAIFILLFPRFTLAQEVEKDKYLAFQAQEPEILPTFSEILFFEPLNSTDFLIDSSEVSKMNILDTPPPSQAQAPPLDKGRLGGVFFEWNEPDYSLSFQTYSTNNIVQANTQDDQTIKGETGIPTNEQDPEQIPPEKIPVIPNEQPLNQSAPSSPEAEMGGQSLSEAANDPTASLMSLQIYDSYTTNFHKLSGSANTVVFRPVIPFKLGNTNNILRITAPIITSNPILNSGLSDLTIFNLVVFNQPWGRWGVGPVALIPTGGANRGAEKWAIGPAIGFTAVKDKLLWGLFNQNLFSFAGDGDRQDVNLSILQPILFYGLGNGWSVANSEMSVTYDWEAGRFSSLPLGIKIGKLVKLGTQPLQLSLQYEHDFANDAIGPANTIQFNLKILFP